MLSVFKSFFVYRSSSLESTHKRVVVPLCCHCTPYGLTHLTVAQHVLGEGSSSTATLVHTVTLCFQGYYKEVEQGLGKPWFANLNAGSQLQVSDCYLIQL